MGLGLSIEAVEERQVLQAELVGKGKGSGDGILGNIMFSGDIKVGLNLFRSEIQASIGLLDDIGSFLIGPEKPGEGFKGAVVGGVS